MFIKQFIRLVFLVSFLFISIHFSIANETNNFDLGRSAFNNKQYSQALSYFENAQQNGVNSVSLKYNIAVIHYKLAQYPQAQLYFNKIIDAPNMRLLVIYNLALIELKLGNKQAAVHLFSKVYRHSNNTKLYSLSKQQLYNLNYFDNKKDVTTLRARVSTSIGHTDNVTSITTGAASGKDDYFTILIANIRKIITGDFDNGLNAKIGFFSRDLLDFDQFDYNETVVKLKYNIKNEKTKNYLSIFVKKSNLNKSAYQSKIGLDIKAINYINFNKNLSYRYWYENINDDNPNYQYLNGYKQRLRIELISKNNKTTNRFRYQLEINDRADTANTSYSPQRNILRYSYREKLSNYWKWKVSVEYRNSQYPNVGNNIRNRTDDRFRIIPAFEYKIARDWNIFGRYEYRDNQSTDLTYDYIRNVIYLDLNWRY